MVFDHNVDPTKDISIPFFHAEAEVDERATRENGGVPIFRDQIMVRIKIPGSKDEVDRPVDDTDKDRWPAQWAQFEKGLKQELDGIPLSEFATASAAERATLAQLGVQTVEQAAGLRDDTAIKLNLFTLRRKAEAFLKTRAEISNTGKLLSTIAKLEKRIEELEGAKNTNSIVSGRDESDGVQPAIGVPDEPRTRRKKVGSTG